MGRPTVEEFGRLLQQFDAAVALGDAGRAKHVAATRELQSGIGIPISPGPAQEQSKDSECHRHGHKEGRREWVLAHQPVTFDQTPRTQLSPPRTT